MEDFANKGAMMAIAGEIFFGSPKEDHKHTIEYGDHATKNITIITTDICKRRATDS